MKQTHMSAALLVEATQALDLDALCQACHAQQSQLLVLVEEGVLGEQDPSPAQWRFDGHALARARRALRLQRELELDAGAVALVLDLLDRIEELQTQLRLRVPAR